MLSYFFITILIYIVFRFITGFLIPVVTATRRMKQQMRNMNSNETGNFTNTTDEGTNVKRPANSTGQTTNQQPGSKDYIEFEEIK